MSLIDDIKRDREAGTPGPWLPDECEGEIIHEHSGAGTWVAAVCCGEYCSEPSEQADTRRIARVPEIEAALLAAEDHLVAALKAISDGYARTDISHEDFRVKAAQFADDALAAYREATK